MIIGLLTTFSVGLSGETTVGGHIRMTVLDMADGESTTGGTVFKDNSSMGMAFTELILYFSHDLSETISVDLQPSWSASTGASPSFGKKIGEQKVAPEDVHAGFHGWVKAVVSVALPYEIDMAVGIVKPRFTWDYGGELFWEDTISGGKFTCNNYLGAMHDTGFEFYKPLEIGDMSLPTYLYIMNGGNQFNDNNRTPLVMLHVEPEFGALKFQASVASGKYDDDDEKSVFRYSAGADFTAGAFNIRAEVAGGTWEDSIVENDSLGIYDDAKPFGYYVKAFYRVTPWAKLNLHYNIVDNNYSGFHYTAMGSETYSSISPGVQFYLSDSAILAVNYQMETRERLDRFGVPGLDDKLEYNRLIVGMRVTF